MRLYEFSTGGEEEPIWLFAANTDQAMAIYAVYQSARGVRHPQVHLQEVRPTMYRGVPQAQLIEALAVVVEGIADYEPGVGWKSVPIDECVDGRVGNPGPPYSCPLLS